MRGWYARWPKELERVNIPEDKAAVALRRLAPLLDTWPREIDRRCLERFALSAYTQGLLDSQQIGKVNP
jgi:hypothetical protein